MEFCLNLEMAKVFFKSLKTIKRYLLGGGPKMADGWDGKPNFSPANSSEDHLKTEQIPQNNF